MQTAFSEISGTAESVPSPGPDKPGQTVTQVINLWALSGCGKTALALYWVQQLESSNRACLAAYAKTDEYSRRPLSSFVQIFESLLDQLFSDPKENAKIWNEAIREALGTHYPFFLSLLSKEYRSLVTMEIHTQPAVTIDVSDIYWIVANDSVGEFRSLFQAVRSECRSALTRRWSKRLMQLFAKPSRPLVLIIDDVHWLPEEEVEM